MRRQTDFARFRRRKGRGRGLSYIDEYCSYPGLEGVENEAIKRSVGEYVREQVHTNGMDSFWLMLKRGYVGTYHKMSEKHLDRYRF